MENTIVLNELSSREKILAAEMALPYGYRSIFELIRRSDKAHHLPNVYRNTTCYVHEYNGETLYFAWDVDLFRHLSKLS